MANFKSLLYNCFIFRLLAKSYHAIVEKKGRVSLYVYIG